MIDVETFRNKWYLAHGPQVTYRERSPDARLGGSLCSQSRGVCIGYQGYCSALNAIRSVLIYFVEYIVMVGKYYSGVILFGHLLR